MDYTIVSVPTSSEAVPEALALTSLYEALQHLPDPRRGQGKRYELALTPPIGDDGSRPRPGTKATDEENIA